MKVAAGKLDRRIAILKRTIVKDASGVAVESYALRTECWAHVQELSGRQVVQASQLDIEGTVRIKIRYRFDIGDTDRIAYRGRIYEIVHRAEFGRYDDIEMMCSEVDPGQDQASYDAANNLGLAGFAVFNPFADFTTNNKVSQ